MITDPIMVVKLLGSLQRMVLTELARPLSPDGVIPIRNESESGALMFISAALTT